MRERKKVGRVLEILRAGELKSQVSQDIKSQIEGFFNCQRKLIIKISTNSRKSADELEIFRLQLHKCKKMATARKLQKWSSEHSEVIQLKHSSKTNSCYEEDRLNRFSI